jgi:hypothetical protein
MRLIPFLAILILTQTEEPLMTRWKADALPEHPRPQMQRKDWLNLNGSWDYAIRPKDEPRPPSFEGTILVPYPVESTLSGVKSRVSPDQRIWYKRTFAVPDAWTGRTLLHFGAVDWEAHVWINGKEVGSHQGGYDPFTFDITDSLQDGDQEILLSAWDPTDAGPQPHGKQVRKPHGIWYTPTTGIWQTVWIEPVPENHIRSLRIVPDLDRGSVHIQVDATGGDEIQVVIAEDDHPTSEGRGKPGEPLEVRVKHPRPWSPDSPYLYTLQVSLWSAGKRDLVQGYFGLRKVSVEKGRILLNGKPLFQYGLLDQGFWPDGLYTAPTDEALKHDIEVTKRLGMNLARKHVKVEPDRWYHWCDRLGLLVWQDMPSGGKDYPKFKQELESVMDALHNHPCIVMWVPFNEGWGQHDTEAITAWIKEKDPTRLVNPASGWTDKGVGDVRDIHSYPGPAIPPPEERRALVLGEFGGLGLPIQGHTWQDEKNWGYRSYESKEALTDAYIDLVRKLRPMIDMGLSAAVYTQTSDVEIEVNGVMTYDRKIIKMDIDRVFAANRDLYRPPARIRTVLPTSRKEGQTWRYATDDPGPGWEKPDFDDSSWEQGPAGFGTKGTPGAVVRTTWDTPDIWIRRTVDLDGGTHLLIHHDEDAEVYVNGEQVAKLSGYTTSYVLVPIDPLGSGRRTLAVHCHQTSGGQYIDVGVVLLQNG